MESKSKHLRRGVGGSLIAAALLAAGCERTPEIDERAPEPTLRGASLVVGTSVDQWSLLGVPRDGGLAEGRALTDLQHVVWTGTAELPASVEAHALLGGRIVLRTADGVIYTYDPASEALVRVGEVAPEAAWHGDSSVGLYLSPGGSILEVARDGTWSYELGADAAWAAPAEGGVLVALDDDAGRRSLWLLRRDEEEPAEQGVLPAGPPGVVTAWGRRAILTSTDGQGLVVMSTSPLERAGELDLGSPVEALAASPSSHEIYATLDAPPRLVAVNRFDLKTVVLSDLESPAATVRPSLFGEGVLVPQDGQVWRIPVAGGPPERVEASWRDDLPVGLPDGRILAALDDRVFVAGPRGAAEADLEAGAAGRWWLAIRWNPVSAVVTAGRLTGEVAGAQAATSEHAAEVDSASADERMEAAPGLRDGVVAPAASGPPPGFYAIVGSARQAEGIRTLVESLGDAGFATEVQRFPDEAGRTWYRGLVGPYRSRSEAEAAARQLLRERRLEAWVTEIGSESRLDEEST